MHPFERLGVVIVVSEAVEQPMDRIEQELVSSLMTEVGSPSPRLVVTDHEIHVEPVVLEGVKGQDVRGRIDVPPSPVGFRHRPVSQDPDGDPSQRRLDAAGIGGGRGLAKPIRQPIRQGGLQIEARFGVNRDQDFGTGTRFRRLAFSVLPLVSPVFGVVIFQNATWLGGMIRH